MKKLITCAVMMVIAAVVFAQVKLPVVAVAPFDATGGVSADEAAVVTELFVSYLAEGGKITLVDRNAFDKLSGELSFQASDWSDSARVARLGRALNAEVIVRGQIMKLGSQFYVSVTMLDINTTTILATAREQLRGLDEIFDKLPALTGQILAKIPEPNYLVGRWRSTYRNQTCILEFEADGTVIVEEYDYDISYVFSAGYKWKARGSGTYSVSGMFSEGAEKMVINLTLTGISNDRARSAFGTVSYNLGMCWKDAAKNSFELGGQWDGNVRRRLWSNDRAHIKGLKSYVSSYSGVGGSYNEFYRIQ